MLASMWNTTGALGAVWRHAPAPAVPYISHRLDEILALADRITVLQDGCSVASLDPRTTTKA